MTITYIQFQPASNSNFQFSPVLDGATYNAVCTWSLWGQRYYINLYDSNGGLIFSLPMIASPDKSNISLTQGYFSTPMIFRGSSQTIEIGS